MTLDPLIRSRSNPLLKRVRAVRAGRVADRVLIEGERLVFDALDSGAELEAVLIDEDADPVEPLAQHPATRRVAAGFLESVTDLKHAPSILALAVTPEIRPLGALELGERALLVVVAGVADPGNCGAIVRAAEAAGAMGVAFAAGGASPTSSKALRGSMGSAFRLPLYSIKNKGELASFQLPCLVASTRGGADFRQVEWPGRAALWIPGETGTAGLEAPADATPISIPMAGRVESLNVATAATLLMFEALRDSPSP